ATSNTFRDSGLVYTVTNLTTPVAAPPLTLPWISGQPHALYARVRAVLAKTTTPWSAAYGFDIVPPAAPTPLQGAPGLLQWTPTEGAEGYQVWLLHAGSIQTVYTNVLDERELYTFHQGSGWTGSVRWRVRALRIDNKGRVNSMPAVSYGPWSDVYTATNPAVTSGPMKLIGTVSDVSSNGSSDSPTHRFMPAFTFTGNTSLTGLTSELYRVYVFTDSQCLNRVFTGAVVGGPAYSPRPYGPLALPATVKDLTAARSKYLGSGTEPAAYTYDGEKLNVSESLAQATPTTTLPTSSDTTSGTGTTGADTGSGSAPASGSTGSGSAPASGTSLVTWDSGTTFGAPVDLWDTEWPAGGYYWTVVPVVAVVTSSTSTSVASPGAASGTKSLTVSSADDVSAGAAFTVGSGATQETVTVTAVNGSTLTLGAALQYTHNVGEPVVPVTGTIEYHDLELPQDACAAGRVMRFGKDSQPALAADGAPYASGLSVGGRLIAAKKGSNTYYGTPLVAWEPALGATVYEVQWSKTRYPFTPGADPASKASGILTSSTSAILPLTPGTWWYRVRGFDYSLPTGSQGMSWSEPLKLVIARPKFAIVADKTKH
ncbi:MAG TPA: hypothetical protein VGF23_05515, partial [Gaiellaceae bacterium]